MPEVAPNACKTGVHTPLHEEPVGFVRGTEEAELDLWTHPNRSLMCDSGCAGKRLLLEVLRGTETDTFLFLLSRPGCNHCCSHTCYQFNLPLCLRANTQQHVFISPVKLVPSVVAVRQRGRACCRTLPFSEYFSSQLPQRVL